MTLKQVVQGGVGELASPHGSPSTETVGNTVIEVEIGLPCRPGERRFRTEFFELTSAQYRVWSDIKERRAYSLEIDDEDDRSYT